MKNLITILTLVLVSNLTYGQDDSRHLQPFDKLSVAGSLDVTLYEGNPRIDITMLKGDLDELEVIQKGKTLKLKFKSKVNWSGNRKAKINLYVDNLSSIDVAAGAKVYSDFTLKASEFYADASSGAELSIAVETTRMDANVNSGGRIIVEGFTKVLNVDGNSGGTYNGVRLKAKDVDADVNSGASVRVWATERIKGNANSGGSIKFKGEPRDENLNTSKWSGGSISKI